MGRRRTLRGLAYKRKVKAVWGGCLSGTQRGESTVSDVVQVRYDELDAVADQIGRVSQVVSNVGRQVSGSVGPLHAGGWQGVAATAFFAEIEAEVQPALQRLSAALDEAATVTRRINTNLRSAEEQAANLFRGGSVAEQPAVATSAAQSEGGVLASAADFLEGAWNEGTDMLSGMWHMVRHPIDTAVGLGHAIAHPGQLWEAVKKPYVEDWESGHPWRAIGRGTLFAASFLLGAHGADKVAKAGELGELAGATGRVGEIADVARIDEVSQAAARVGRTGEVLEPSATTAREAFQPVYRQLEEGGWKADARSGAVWPDTARHPTVEVRPSGGVLGTHNDLTKYLRETGLTGGRGDVATLESHHLLDVYDAHAQMYREAGHPEWVTETRQFLRSQRSTIENAYHSGNVPGSQFPDFAARRQAALRFLDGL